VPVTDRNWRRRVKLSFDDVKHREPGWFSAHLRNPVRCRTWDTALRSPFDCLRAGAAKSSEDARRASGLVRNEDTAVKTLLLSTAAAASILMVAVSPGVAQQASPGVRPDLTGQVSSLAPDAVYNGWRSRQLVGQQVAGKNGNEAGIVRDLIIDADARLAALVIEGGGVLGIPEAVYRVPWSQVDLTPGRAGITVNLSGGERPRYGLFPGTEGVETLPREFRVSEVVGDYARLQTGHGYGYVSDVVFDPDGRMIAVLVSREPQAGGGTYAFPYPGATGRWDPGLS